LKKTSEQDFYTSMLAQPTGFMT